MRRVLFLGDDLPFPFKTGASLRVFNVARQLAERGDSCHLAVLHADGGALDAVSGEAVFESVSLLPQSLRRPNVLRHLRLGDTHYNQRARRRDFTAAIRMLNDIVVSRRIEIVIATSVYVAEFARQLKVPLRVLDAGDSMTLTLERDRDASQRGSIGERLSTAIRIARMKHLEGGLTRSFDMLSGWSANQLQDQSSRA